MWNSKKPTELLTHVLYIKDNSGNAFSGFDLVNERTNYDAPRGSQVKRDSEAEEKYKVGGRETSFLSQAPP